LIPIIPQLSKYNKVLYLDCDTLILKNIYNVFNITTNKEIVLFYDDIQHLGFGNKKYIKRSIDYIKQNKIICNNHINKQLCDILYLNSGVILFNMTKFKCDNYINRLKYYNDIYNKSIFHYCEQDLINYCYDYEISYEKYNSSIIDTMAYILHLWYIKICNRRVDQFNKYKIQHELVYNKNKI
jgi:lipopolysaccharide biosynthesis glycosyltransferase